VGTGGSDSNANCGAVLCPPGKICCNPVMGTCADPGGVCVQ
jgi:hypothetical protein